MIIWQHLNVLKRCIFIIHMYHIYAVPTRFKYRQNACVRYIVFKYFLWSSNSFKGQNACFRDIVFKNMSAVPNRFKYHQNAGITPLVIRFGHFVSLFLPWQPLISVLHFCKEYYDVIIKKCYLYLKVYLRSHRTLIQHQPVLQFCPVHTGLSECPHTWWCGPRTCCCFPKYTWNNERNTAFIYLR